MAKIPKTFMLQDKTAIVVGTAENLSRHLAFALAEVQAHVFFVSSDEETVKKATEEAYELGYKITGTSGDVTNALEVERISKKAFEELGKVDILVNNAIVEFGKPFLEMSDREWKDVIETNVNPAYLWCKTVGRHMLARRNGRIINICSGLAVSAMPNRSAYCASMGAILQLTKALAIEWVRQGIRVNAIGLGWFSQKDASETKGELDPLLRYIPMGRLGHPSDLGGLLVYLASDISDYVTGQIMFVDGGIINRP